MPRPAWPADFAAHLDPRGGAPLHQQLYEQVRGAVLAGTLVAGQRLPASRVLAANLGVSRTTVLSAYEQLAAEGYLEGRSGAGTRVAERLPERPARRAKAVPGPRRLARRAALLLQDRFGTELRLAGRGWRTPFRLAVPALDEVPLALWTRLVARAQRQQSGQDLDYQDSRGLPRLRRAIAAHLALGRGIACTPEQVLVTAGAQSALDLAVRLLLDPGERAIVEDPGHLGIKGALRGAGAEIVPLPVDAEGLVFDPRAAAGARLLCLTPSNQFPLAATLSLPRRLAILAWAEASGAWIVEDDYDSEFRFAGRPLEALAALDRAQRVLYLGTFSKVLFPGLRLGYLVVPPDLADAFAAAKRFVDVHPPPLLQAALAAFIEEGHFARHLRRLRGLYGERSERLVAALQRRLGGLLSVTPPQAGLHVVARLPEGSDPESGDDVALAARAAAAGIELRPLSAYGLGHRPAGFVLGYGHLRPREIESAVARLQRSLLVP